MASHQRARAATESVGFLLVTAGILVAANVVVQFINLRFDCTANDLFSLSDGSKRLAGDLTDQLEIKAYFTEDLPPPFHATRQYVKDILDEYVAASNGRITVTFVNPDTDAEKEAAREAGVVEVEHAALKEGSTSIVRGYRGLVMRYLDRTEVIPVVQDTAGLEYSITMKIKKMVGDRRPIGVLTGHEGPTLAEGLSKLRACLPIYELREVSAASAIDEELAALLVVDPQTAISEDELRQIDRYVMGGGSVGFFGGGMKVDLSGMEPTATPVETGLNTLLRPWGVVMRQGIIHDARCGRVPMRTQLGPLPVPYPPMPELVFDEVQQEHPVLFRLPSTQFPFTSPVETTEAAAELEGVEATTLISSSENSWLVTGSPVSLRPRNPREWTQTNDVGPFSIGVALEGRLPSAFPGAAEGAEGGEASPARAADDVQVLVVGGSFFLRDEMLPPADPGGDCQLSSHLAFALNAIDWLAQDSDLIAIRAKNVEEPTIDVPRDVREADEAARGAATEADEAGREALTAAAKGDEQGAEAAVQQHEDARGRRDNALEDLKGAQEKWEGTKALYRWGNMLGIPLAFAIFGLVRWQMRQNKRRHLTL